MQSENVFIFNIFFLYLAMNTERIWFKHAVLHKISSIQIRIYSVTKLNVAHCSWQRKQKKINELFQNITKVYVLALIINIFSYYIIAFSWQLLNGIATTFSHFIRMTDEMHVWFTKEWNCNCIGKSVFIQYIWILYIYRNSLVIIV